MDARWQHGQTLAAGQVVEFKVWAELERQSMGGLHLFLPLRDLGIDGVVHRLADGLDRYRVSLLALDATVESMLA